MPGGSSTPPGPFVDNLFIPMNEENQEVPPVEDKEKSLNKEMSDYTLDPDYQRASVKREKISLLLDKIFIEDGIWRKETLSTGTLFWTSRMIELESGDT